VGRAWQHFLYLYFTRLLHQLLLLSHNNIPDTVTSTTVDLATEQLDLHVVL